MQQYKEKYNAYLDFLRSQNHSVDKFTEFKFEALEDPSEKGTTSDVVDWYYEFVKNCSMRAEVIPLSECRQWSLDASGSLVHESGEFFRVEGYRISGTNSREVKKGWDQPFLTQVGFDGGILGLVRQKHDGVPYYLVEAKEEPGNYNIAQISTTVQATFSNLKRAHKGSATNYSYLFLEPENHPVEVLIDQWTSEDGGRLYNKRNRSMLIEYDEDKELEIVSERFKWVTLYQLKQMIYLNDAIVAPHIRGILACI